MPGHGSAEDVHGRRCGSCAVCCTHLPIPAGQVSVEPKPAGVACAHLCPTGCAVYSRRPQMCADFRCAWLGDPSWPDRWRPDRCGLLCLREDVHGKTPMAAIYETEPQARRRPVAEAILAELVRTVAVVVMIDFRGRRLRISGDWRPHAQHAPVPAPHFLRRGKHSARPGAAGVPLRPIRTGE